MQNSWMPGKLPFSSRLSYCHSIRHLKYATAHRLKSIIIYCLTEIPGRTAYINGEKKKWKPGYTELLNKFNSCPKTGDLNTCIVNSHYSTHTSFPSRLQEAQFQQKKALKDVIPHSPSINRIMRQSKDFQKIKASFSLKLLASCRNHSHIFIFVSSKRLFYNSK